MSVHSGNAWIEMPDGSQVQSMRNPIKSASQAR